MSELRDQDFRVGDEVVFLNADHPNETFTICQSQDAGLYPFVASNETCGYLPVTRDGRTSIYANWQMVYHKDAIVFDACGKVHSTNEMFIKSRGPKIVTKEPHEFLPFKKVLVADEVPARDAHMDNTWRCDFFSHYRENANYPFVCVGDAWSRCIPYESNEHLLGKEI